MFVHIMTESVYTERYIDFINKNRGKKTHFFYVSGPIKNTRIAGLANVLKINGVRVQWLLLKNSFIARGILIHQLNQPKILIFLMILNPIAIKKTAWVIWGGDLNFLLSSPPNVKLKLIRLFYERLVKRLNYIIAHIPGDYNLLNQRYPLKSQYLCAKYPGPNELINIVERPSKIGGEVVIMVGNSADPSNRHIEAFQLIRRFSDEKIAVHVVLSYGKDTEYINRVVEEGFKLFGNCFVPHLEFMPYDDYLALLSTVDVCIFYHNRQQGMGNLNLFFSLGTKVFISENVTTFEYYSSLGLEVFSTESIEELSFSTFTQFGDESRKNNNLLISRDMDSKGIKNGWEKVFSLLSL